MDNIREFGPLAALGTVLGGLVADGGYLLATAIDWIFATIDLWLPFVSTFANTLAPRIAWIDQGTADALLLGVATVFLLVLLHKIIRRTIE